MLAYTSHSYSEEMVMPLALTYIPCATSLMGQIGNIITFTQFEEGNLSSETRNDAESGDKSDDNSIMPPLLSEEEMDSMYSGNESDHDLISKEMLEDIRDRSQSHPNVNKIESRYKICDSIRQRQSEWKSALKLPETSVKFYTRDLRLL